MSLIATSTVSTATAYSNQRKIDRTSNGVLWATASQDGIRTVFLYSIDNGVTWAEDVSARIGTTGTSHVRNHSFFIDVDDYAHIAYKNNNDGYIYYHRGTPNAARTAWTWSAAVTLISSGSRDYPDIVAHREGSGWKAHVVTANFASTTWTQYVPITIQNDGSISVGSTSYLGGGYANSNPTYPSIDFNHTGDGKTVKDGTPHLYVAWSAGATGAGNGIRFKKATYSGGSWTWGTERSIDPNRYINNDYRWLNCLFDGTRVIISGGLAEGSNNDIVLYERDAADTVTTTRVLIENAGLSSRFEDGSATYDSDGNVYIVGAHWNSGGTALTTVHWVKWTRSTDTLGAPTVIDFAGISRPHVSVRRGHSNDRIEFIYTDGTASPYSVMYSNISLNALPESPTLISNGAVLKNNPITINWTHNDPDNDPQAKYQIRWREVV